MSIFSDDTDPALHASTLFGPMDAPNKPHDPWSALATSSEGTSVSRMLTNTIVPEIYSKSFELAGPIDGVVDASELVKVLEAAKLSTAQIDNVVATIHSPATIDRGTWNVAMALAGFAQRGTKDLNLHMVDFSKNSLPNVKIPGLSETIVESSGPWNDNSTTNTPTTAYSRRSIMIPMKSGSHHLTRRYIALSAKTPFQSQSPPSARELFFSAMLTTL